MKVRCRTRPTRHQVFDPERYHTHLEREIRKEPEFKKRRQAVDRYIYNRKHGLPQQWGRRRPNFPPSGYRWTPFFQSNNYIGVLEAVE